MEELNKIISGLYAKIDNQEKIIRELQEKYNNKLDENIKLSEETIQQKEDIERVKLARKYTELGEVIVKECVLKEDYDKLNQALLDIKEKFNLFKKDRVEYTQHNVEVMLSEIEDIVNKAIGEK